MESLIIINQVAILAILAGIGIFTSKLGIITEKTEEGISKIVFSITLPLLIFTGLINLDITPDLLKNGLNVIVLAFFSLMLLFATGIISTRLLKLDYRKGTIHTLHTMFGNIVFLGFPLVNALFPGGEGLFYATLFYLVSTSITWTLGIYLLNRGKNPDILSNLRHLLNPNTVAFIAGSVFVLAGIRLPQVLNTPLAGLGNTTNYLAMLYIGAMLAKISIKGIFTQLSVFVLCFNKQLLIPFFLVLITGYISDNYNLNETARVVVILQAAMPSMAVIVVLARRFGADDRLATENLFFTTVLSLFTLPFVYYLTGLF